MTRTLPGFVGPACQPLRRPDSAGPSASARKSRFLPCVIRTARAGSPFRQRRTTAPGGPERRSRRHHLRRDPPVGFGGFARVIDPEPCQVRHPDEAGAQAIWFAVEMDEDPEAAHFRDDPGDDPSAFRREDEGSQEWDLARPGGEVERTFTPTSERPISSASICRSSSKSSDGCPTPRMEASCRGIRPISLFSPLLPSTGFTRTSVPSNPMTSTVLTGSGWSWSIRDRRRASGAAGSGIEASPAPVAVQGEGASLPV